MSRPIEIVLSKLKNVKAHQDYYQTLCPAHDDRRASLSVSEGHDGRCLLHCHAGCSPEAVVEAIGLEMKHLFVQTRGKPAIVAIYDYLDENGKLLYQVLKDENKEFPCRRPNGAGGWHWKLGKTRRVLYHLPALLAEPDRVVFIAEGEKSADAVAGLGLLSTTNPHGAGKWRDEYAATLRDRHAVIIPDNDHQGLNHARDIALNLQDVAASVRVLELPGLAPKGDVYDWIADGGDREALESLVRSAPTGEEWLKEKKPSEGWQWRTLADAYEPKEPRAYVVSNVLPLPSLTVAYGSPGDLKSMLMLDLALCVATGKPWLEGFPEQEGVQAFDCQQVATLWVDVDNGLDRTERRLCALGKTHGAPADAPLAFVSFPSPPFVASDPEAIDLVVNAATTTNAKLIVIDNLGAVSGGADENSSQMVEIMSGLRWLAEATSAAVVVIHHRTKADRARKGNQLRGHSSIEGSLDLALFIERKEGTDTITVQSTKSRDIPIEPFEALWTYESDGRDLTAGCFYGLGNVESEAKSKRKKARDAILTAVEETPGLSQTDIVEAVAGTAGRGLVLSVLKALVREGQLEERTVERKNTLAYYFK